MIRSLDRAQNSIGFLEAVFSGVAMEWLRGDDDVWSVELEYRPKRAMTFYLTVRSRSKFSIGCFAWGSDGMTTR